MNARISRTTVPIRRASHLATPASRKAALRRLQARAAAPDDSFTRLIDAHQAAELLGVPYTWLLADARARRVPHHRLGRYVRFSPADLKEWLERTKIEPATSSRRG